MIEGGEHTPHREHEDEDAEREAPFGQPPRIYVASLSDYNNGILHGEWIDAGQDPDEIHEQVQVMLAASESPGAEEWAIHDYMGFGPIALGEYEPIERVAEIAERLLALGRPYAWWHDYCGGDDDLAVRFADAYLGSWESVEDYAHDLVDEIGMTIHVEPESWSSYVSFDYEALARDLEMELHVAHDGRSVHVFNPHV